MDESGRRRRIAQTNDVSSERLDNVPCLREERFFGSKILKSRLRAAVQFGPSVVCRPPNPNAQVAVQVADGLAALVRHLP